MKKELFSKKNIIKLFIFLILIILLIFLLFREKESYDLVIGYSSSQVPLVIAKEKGYFNDYGVNVKFVLFESSKYSRIALSTGQIDMTGGGTTSYFDPISKGVNLKVIAPITVATPQLYVRPNELHTFQDLNNKRYGMKIDGSDSYILREILKENNLDININYVDVDNSYKVLALMDKNLIDFVSAKETENAIFTSSGAVLLDEFQDKGYTKKRYLVSSIIVNGSYLENNQKNVDAFIEVYIKAQKFIKENPVEASQILINKLNKDAVDSKVYTLQDGLDVINANNSALWINPKELEALIISAKEFGLIDTNITLNDVYDNRYEEKLRIAQEEIYGLND